MIDFNEPRNLLIGLFALVCLVVGIFVAAQATRGKAGKAASSFVVVLIGCAIASLGPIALALGPRILASLGFVTGAGN